MVQVFRCISRPGFVSQSVTHLLKLTRHFPNMIWYFSSLRGDKQIATRSLLIEINKTIILKFSIKIWFFNINMVLISNMLNISCCGEEYIIIFSRENSLILRVKTVLWHSSHVVWNVTKNSFLTRISLPQGPLQSLFPSS